LPFRVGFIQSNQKGIVVDEFGNAIENAYIVNTTSETHAHTNELGMFSIDKSIVGNISNGLRA
jgi:hypothetical protein